MSAFNSSTYSKILWVSVVCSMRAANLARAESLLHQLRELTAEAQRIKQNPLASVETGGPCRQDFDISAPDRALFSLLALSAAAFALPSGPRRTLFRHKLLISRLAQD